MALYIAAHKEFAVQEMDGYVPLHVGAAGGKDLPYVKDNTGEHISEKNPHFCELTGLYWIWKNCPDSYKGLVHYRRYFTYKGRRIREEDIETLLQQYDILLPRTVYLRESAYEEFCLHSGHEQDLVLLRRAVETIDPSVLPAYDRVMAGNRLHLCNMLIAPAQVFDAYCAWLFDVLFELEKHVDMTGYTPYQQRLYGFLSERLLNVFVLHNGLRVGTLPVCNTEQSRMQKWRMWALQIKNRVLFALKK